MRWCNTSVPACEEAEIGIDGMLGEGYVGNARGLYHGPLAKMVCSAILLDTQNLDANNERTRLEDYIWCHKLAAFAGYTNEEAMTALYTDHVAAQAALGNCGGGTSADADYVVFWAAEYAVQPSDLVQLTGLTMPCDVPVDISVVAVSFAGVGANAVTSQILVDCSPPKVDAATVGFKIGRASCRERV